MRHILVSMMAAITLLLSTAALGFDWEDYPQFLHLSALPGNGFGVDNDGQVGFHGAYHMNVPCAYTPSRGNYSISYYSASDENRVRFRFGGTETNGTGHIGVGLGKPGRGLYVTEVFVDEDFVNTVNLQWQVLPEDLEKPAVAIGILDIFDQRQKRGGINGGARSFYATATRQVSHGDQPAYASIGIGDGKFNGLFGAVTWYPADWVNLGFEYDGRIERPHAAFRVYENDGLTAAVGAAWSNFDRPVVGFSLTYSR